MGLFWKSICPASLILFSLNNEITCGIGVLMGQPCIHRGFLQLRHLFASVEIYKAIYDLQIQIERKLLLPSINKDFC